MHKAFIAIVVSLVLATAAYAHNPLEPVTNAQQTAANQEVSLNFTNTTGALYGRFVYAGSNPAGSRFFGFANYSGDFMQFSTANLMIFRAPGSTEQMRINSGGVTIGTNPDETATKFTVLGAIDVRGNIAAKFQDVAEWVSAFGDPSPGTVVVLSDEATDHVTASSTAYDTRVAGVVSAQPGVILGEPGESKVKVATTGRVKVMVDATSAPIAIGDLLVTSDRTGTAMKSVPLDLGGVPIHRPGTVVGKALEPLKEGVGEILVLLSLQ